MKHKCGYLEYLHRFGAQHIPGFFACLTNHSSHTNVSNNVLHSNRLQPTLTNLWRKGQFMCNCSSINESEEYSIGWVFDFHTKVCPDSVSAAPILREASPGHESLDREHFNGTMVRNIIFWHFNVCFGCISDSRQPIVSKSFFFIPNWTESNRILYLLLKWKVCFFSRVYLGDWKIMRGLRVSGKICTRYDKSMVTWGERGGRFNGTSKHFNCTKHKKLVNICTKPNNVNIF